MLKRCHYLPMLWSSPNYFKVLSSSSIREAATVSSSCDRWLGSSLLVAMGSEPTQIFSFLLKKIYIYINKKKRKKTPKSTCSCQLRQLGKSSISTKASLIFSLLTYTIKFLKSRFCLLLISNIFFFRMSNSGGSLH